MHGYRGQNMSTMICQTFLYCDLTLVCTLKQVGCHTCKAEKNQVSILQKIWVDPTLKKSQVVPYKNLDRFYRLPFKSVLRVQIKRVNNLPYFLLSDLKKSFIFFLITIFIQRMD